MPSLTMLNAEDYEEWFLRALQTYDPRTPTAVHPNELLEHLDPRSRHRWRIYADGYVARFCNALVTGMLDRIAVLYDEGFVKSILFDFMTAHPPQSLILPNALSGFAEYLRDESEHAERTDLIDLIRLTSLRWQVLVGPDPDPAQRADFRQNPGLDLLFLEANHALLSSVAPIYSLWQAAEKRLTEETISETFIPSQAETVLFFKSSATDLNCLAIPEPFGPFVQRLSQGLSLASSLEGLDFESPAIEGQFIDLMRTLQTLGAFVFRP